MIKTRKDSRIEFWDAADVTRYQNFIRNGIDPEMLLLQAEPEAEDRCIVEVAHKDTTEETKEPTGYELMQAAGYSEGVAVNDYPIRTGVDEWLRIFTSKPDKGCAGVVNIRVIRDGTTGEVIVYMEQIDIDGQTLGCWTMEAAEIEALTVVLQEIRREEGSNA